MNEHDHDATDPAPEALFRLMCLIQEHPEYSQRRLAEAMGISLGKAHYLLKALFGKGLVKAGRLGRDPRKLLYVLTTEGLHHRLDLTRHFLQRKEQEFELLKAQIERLREQLGDQAPAPEEPGH